MLRSNGLGRLPAALLSLGLSLVMAGGFFLLAGLALPGGASTASAQTATGTMTGTVTPAVETTTATPGMTPAATPVMTPAATPAVTPTAEATVTATTTATTTAMTTDTATQTTVVTPAAGTATVEGTQTGAGRLPSTGGPVVPGLALVILGLLSLGAGWFLKARS